MFLLHSGGFDGEHDDSRIEWQFMFDEARKIPVHGLSATATDIRYLIPIVVSISMQTEQTQCTHKLELMCLGIARSAYKTNTNFIM